MTFILVFSLLVAIGIAGGTIIIVVIGGGFGLTYRDALVIVLVTYPAVLCLTLYSFYKALVTSFGFKRD
jgi:hypothetical protein